MKDIISTSINNLISVLTSPNVTEEQKTKLLEVMGTLQGLLIIENRK